MSCSCKLTELKEGLLEAQVITWIWNWCLKWGEEGQSCRTKPLTCGSDAIPRWEVSELNCTTHPAGVRELYRDVGKPHYIETGHRILQANTCNCEAQGKSQWKMMGLTTGTKACNIQSSDEPAALEGLS